MYTPPDSEGCADLYKHSGILAFEQKKKFDPFSVGELHITPVPLIHSKPTFGYLFEHDAKRVAYLTDTKGLPPKTEAFLAEHEMDLLVIDCSYAPDYDGKGHNNLDEVLQIQEVLQAHQVVLTHIGHDFDLWLRSEDCNLPGNFHIGFDGKKINL